MLVMKSATLDRLCLKDINEKIIDIKQIFFDAEIIESEILSLKNVDYKTEKAFKLEMTEQVTEQENDLDKDTLLNILKKAG